MPTSQSLMQFIDSHQICFALSQALGVKASSIFPDNALLWDCSDLTGKHNAQSYCANVARSSWRLLQISLGLLDEEFLAFMLACLELLLEVGFHI